MSRTRRITLRPEGDPRSVLTGAGWRARPLAALLGLRPPAADHSAAEAAALAELAVDADVVVEIGVAEGASAYAIAQRMAPGGRLWCIDPYLHGHFFGWSAAELVARRLLRGSPATITWIRATSVEAAVGWTTPIDLLQIDGEHTHEAVRRDWLLWSPHVVVGGHVTLRWRLRPDGSDLSVGAWLATEFPAWTMLATYDDIGVLRRMA